jgi:hypothetical protein
LDGDDDEGDHGSRHNVLSIKMQLNSVSIITLAWDTQCPLEQRTRAAQLSDLRPSDPKET